MNISVLGLWRDAGQYVHKTLDNLDSIVNNNQDHSFTFYFYENDSTDNTKEVLEDWIKNYKGKIFSEKLGFPKFGSVIDTTRLVLLSYYRNKLKELCESRLESDYTLLIDTDIIFDNNHFQILLKNIIDLNAAMVVANTRQHAFGDLMLGETTDTFYDAFAFRDRYNQQSLYFTDCPLTLQKDRELWKSNLPIRIMSGFSGFALIKTDIFNSCHWSTVGHSEHINFCYDINRYGDIFIIPSCKPYTEIDISKLDLQQLEKNAKAQVPIVEQINRIYETSISSKLIPK